MLLPLAGEVIVTTGAAVSRRVTLTEALPVLLAASVQETEIVLAPNASAWLEPFALLQVGVAPELSVAVKFSVTDEFDVLLPSVGEEIVTTGGVLSSRVIVTEALPTLSELSSQLTVSVLLPIESGWLAPLVLSQVGVSPVLSVAVKVSATLEFVVLVPFNGEVIATTGTTLSSRETLTDALELLLAASWQVTVIVFAPNTSEWLDPLALSQLGVAPELSVAV